MMCSERRGGNGCARCGSAVHRLKDCPQRTNNDQKASTQTDKSDPLAFMIETKVMEVTWVLLQAQSCCTIFYRSGKRRSERCWILGRLSTAPDEALVRHVGGCLSRKLPGMLLYPDRRKALVRGTTELEVRGPGYREKLSFWVVQGLGVSILLGAPWLRTWNPTINWKTRELTFSDGVR